MKLHELTCPKCQGSLDIKIDDRKYIHCPYCGQMFSVDNGKREYTINKNINITHTQRKIDEAEIIKAKNKAKEDKNTALITIALLIFFAFMFVLLAIFSPELDAEQKQKTQEAIDAGKISAGSSYDYEETDYEAVVEQLKLLGFTNVTAVDLKDAGLALWKNGKVVNVSIDGETSFGSNDYFDPDAVVIITHH